MNPLLERLMGAIQSPAAQGVAGAALVGANPLLGLVAAPALAQSRRRAEREESAAKLELEARAEALAAARSQREAQAQLPALLNEVAGRQPAGMVGPPPSPGVAQNRLLAALSQSAPAQFTQAAMNRALPQPTRAPANLETMQALGFEMSPEGYASFRAAGGQPQSDALQDLLRTMQIRALQREEDTATREESERVEAEATGDAVEAATSAELAGEARTLLSELGELEGTPLAPGSSDAVSSVIRAGQGAVSTAANALGIPAGQSISRNNASFDNLKKTLARLRNTAVDLVTGEGATNAERAAAAEGFPSASMEPDAIRSGLRSFAENQVRRLEAQGAGEAAIKPFRDLIAEMDSVTVEYD